MQPINFLDYRQRILDALNTRADALGINEPTTLIDGFISQPLQSELTGAFVIGGPTIPMIAVVGQTSGKIYYFALKALLPDINI